MKVSHLALSCSFGAVFCFMAMAQPALANQTRASKSAKPAGPPEVSAVGDRGAKVRDLQKRDEGIRQTLATYAQAFVANDFSKLADSTTLDFRNSMGGETAWKMRLKNVTTRFEMIPGSVEIRNQNGNVYAHFNLVEPKTGRSQLMSSSQWFMMIQQIGHWKIDAEVNDTEL